MKHISKYILNLWISFSKVLKVRINLTSTSGAVKAKKKGINYDTPHTF